MAKHFRYDWKVRISFTYMQVSSSSLLCAESVRSSVSAASHLSGFISGGSFPEPPRYGNLTIRALLIAPLRHMVFPNVELSFDLILRIQPSAVLPGIHNAASGVSPTTPQSEEEMSRSEESPRLLHSYFTLTWFFSLNALLKYSRVLRLTAKESQQARRRPKQTLYEMCG